MDDVAERQTDWIELDGAVGIGSKHAEEHPAPESQMMPKRNIDSTDRRQAE